MRDRGEIIVSPKVDDVDAEPLDIGENWELGPKNKPIPSIPDLEPEIADPESSSREMLNTRGEVRRGMSQMAKVKQQRIRYGPSNRSTPTPNGPEDTHLSPLQSREYQDFPLFANPILYGDMSRQYDWDLD